MPYFDQLCLINSVVSFMYVHSFILYRWRMGLLY